MTVINDGISKIMTSNISGIGMVEPRHDDDHHEDDGSSVMIAKIVAMLVLGVCTLILGLLPLWLSRKLKWHTEGKATSTQSQMTLSLLRALGGGALLATTFLHMLPETRESVEHLQEEDMLPDTSFHLPELLVCCGFFIMYTVEEVVHSYVHWRERKGAACSADDAATVHRSLSIRRCSNTSQGCAEGDCASDCTSECVPGTPSAAGAPTRQDASAPAALDNPKIFLVHPEKQPGHRDECTRVQMGHAVPDYGTVISSKGPQAGDEMRARGRAHSHGHSHAHGHSHLPPGVDGGGGGVAAGLRGLLVVLALSVHELFEGLAVGLQSTAALVYYLMGAVAAHKLVLAFCVGLEMVAARTRTRLAVLYVLVFAAVSPVGIGVGIALSGDGGGSEAENSVANSVLQGLAAGTLLYVVFFEVLQREHANASGLGLRQLIAVVIGFGIMFGLLAVSGHDHDHGHSHSSVGVSSSQEPTL